MSTDDEEKLSVSLLLGEVPFRIKKNQKIKLATIFLFLMKINKA